MERGQNSRRGFSRVGWQLGLLIFLFHGNLDIFSCTIYTGIPFSYPHLLLYAAI